MSDTITLRTNNKNHTIKCVVVHDERWYRAKDITTALLYKDPQKAVQYHISIDNKRRLNELKPQANLEYTDAISIYINEAGLRSLVVTKSITDRFRHSHATWD